jgi:hypothetical protein
MDKVKLNKEHLDYLKQFIISKGFKDHAVVFALTTIRTCCKNPPIYRLIKTNSSLYNAIKMNDW